MEVLEKPVQTMGRGPVVDARAHPITDDEADIVEHAEVVADEGLSGRELLGEMTDAELLGSEEVEDAPAQWLAEGPGDVDRLTGLHGLIVARRPLRSS